MTDLLVVRALLFAGECFLASLLLPLLGFAITALLRRAALRHLVWTMLFGVLAVLPIVALLLPPRRIVEHAPAAAMAPMPVAIVAVPVPAPPPSVFTLENAVLLLVALWLLGLGWQAMRLALGQVGLMRLRRASVPFVAAPESRCDVRLAAGEDGPATFGVLRPVVLLPRSASAWPASRLEAVLRHERAHIARRDIATQGLARLVCAIFWLNPLLWLGYRSLRRDAEIAADDAVLASGMAASLYATELVRLAAENNGTVHGLAMARPPLTRRVEAVLAENSSRKGVTRMDMARMGLLGLTATLLLGAARFDLAVAEDAAPVPSVEKRVDRTVDSAADKAFAAEAKAKAEAHVAEVKAQTDAVVARAKAKAEAETDPAKKAEYEKRAAQTAADAVQMRAAAERMAADARLRAQSLAEHQAAEKAETEAMRRAADARTKILADRVGNPALSENKRIAATQALADGALARTQDAFARQAQTLQGEADAGKLQLNKLAADAVATARQYMAQARTFTAQTAEERERMERVRAAAANEGVVLTFPGADAQKLKVGVDATIDPALTAAMQRPEVRQIIDKAVQTAMADAQSRIDAAIKSARAKAGLPPAAATASHGTWSYDVRTPDAYDVPPVPPAALPVPPRAPN